jgi:S1-C subfamily serine protease
VTYVRSVVPVLLVAAVAITSACGYGFALTTPTPSTRASDTSVPAPASPSLTTTDVARIGSAATVYVEHVWGTPNQPWVDADPACAPISGSGAYLGNGNILTAAHVVFPVTGHHCWPGSFDPFLLRPVEILSSYATTRIRDSSGATSIGTVSMIDFEADLALVTVSNLRGIPALDWGDSRQLRIGDAILAIGYPVTGATVTKGIVSALQTVPRRADSTRTIDLVQTDAAVNHGNSGGPLLNDKGELVGIVDFRIEGGNYGLNFAVASSTARRWVATGQ